MDATQKHFTFARAGGIAFGIGTQLFFAVTVYFLFFFLRDGMQSAGRSWFVVDFMLALQFAVVHSILLLPAVRSRIGRVLASPLYGSLFATATCVGLWLMFVLWRSSPTVVWSAVGWQRTLVVAGFYASWVALFYSLHLGGLGYQTGLTQWLHWLRREPLPKRGFNEHGAYRWLRHPVYLSFLGLIWFTPRMTADHAVLTATWTVYIFAGSYFKDLRLTYYLGDNYREYASRVPGYPGMLFGPLAKWPAPRPVALRKSESNEARVAKAAA